MRSICIMNQKGGVGKTTTALNLASGLSRSGKRVLLVDLDPQGNISTALKIQSDHDLYDALKGEVSIFSCITKVAENLDAITSRETLAKAEYYISRQDNTRMVLKSVLKQIKGYDYIIIDCPPSLGILNQNVLAFCEEAFIPVSTDYLGLNALSKMTEIITQISRAYDHPIKITKIIPTLFDKRLKTCRDTLDLITNEYAEITSYPIRVNSKLKEAPKEGKSIFSYAKKSNGAKDYGKLVEDVLAMES